MSKRITFPNGSISQTISYLIFYSIDHGFDFSNKTHQGLLKAPVISKNKTVGCYDWDYGFEEFRGNWGKTDDSRQPLSKATAKAAAALRKSAATGKRRLGSRVLSLLFLT